MRAAGVSLFAHGLGGFGQVSNNEVYGFGTLHSDFASYAFGGGADMPLVWQLKLRVTADYLGASITPGSGSVITPSHYRFGVGLAYHFQWPRF
jgi:hypothetical protein